MSTPAVVVEPQLDKAKPQKGADLTVGRANWFVLDSLDRTNSTPGVLGEAQLRWLESALDAHAGKPALVMVHHNPGGPGNKNGLTETDALMAILRQALCARIAGATGRDLAQEHAAHTLEQIVLEDALLVAEVLLDARDFRGLDGLGLHHHVRIA